MAVRPRFSTASSGKKVVSRENPQHEQKLMKQSASMTFTWKPVSGFIFGLFCSGFSWSDKSAASSIIEDVFSLSSLS